MNPLKSKVLHYLNNDNNAGLIKTTLERSDLEIEVLSVSSSTELLKNIPEFGPDVVIAGSDQTAENILDELHQRFAEIPFIVAGEISEEAGLEYVRHGAFDYVNISDLNKLPNAIERALLRRQLTIEREKVAKLNEELERTAAEREFKTNEMNSSFSYASRIVDAMLPGIKEMNKLIPNSFIIHQPKELIGGDFYFFTEVQDGYIIASADSTGHGVPGALISMLGYHLLKDVVIGEGITRPGQILKKLDQYVSSSLHKEERRNALRDGMDISICLVNKVKQTIEFAGANQSLFFSANGRVFEFKSDKTTVGDARCTCIHNFTTQCINYQKGDRFYLASDGLQDQLGGPEERRMTKKNVSAILNLVRDLSLQDQKEFIYDSFVQWKGTNEQTDDVMLIGVEL